MVRIHLSDSLQLHTLFSLRSFFGALLEWSLSGPVLAPSVIIRVDSHIFRNYLGWKSPSSIHNKAHECMLSHFSCVWLCATIWTVACQPPLSKGLSRKEYWNGLPCPPPGDLPDPGIESTSLTSNFHWQAGPGKPIINHVGLQIHQAAKARLMPWTQRIPRLTERPAGWEHQSECCLGGYGRLCQSLLYSTVTHTHTHTHSFPMWSIPQDRI